MGDLKSMACVVFFHQEGSKGYCEEYTPQGKFCDMISVFRAAKMHLL